MDDGSLIYDDIQKPMRVAIGGIDDFLTIVIIHIICRI